MSLNMHHTEKCFEYGFQLTSSICYIIYQFLNNGTLQFFVNVLMNLDTWKYKSNNILFFLIFWGNVGTRRWQKFPPFSQTEPYSANSEIKHTYYLVSRRRSATVCIRCWQRSQVSASARASGKPTGYSTLAAKECSWPFFSITAFDSSGLWSSCPCSGAISECIHECMSRCFLLMQQYLCLKLIDSVGWLQKS